MGCERFLTIDGLDAIRASWVEASREKMAKYNQILLQTWIIGRHVDHKVFAVPL
jgi:hypothetical protein